MYFGYNLNDIFAHLQTGSDASHKMAILGHQINLENFFMMIFVFSTKNTMGNPAVLLKNMKIDVLLGSLVYVYM